LRRASWSALDRLAQQPNGTGLAWLNSQVKLCPDSVLTDLANMTVVKDYLEEIWTDLAMMDYPYPTSFLAPLPANPVAAACAAITKQPAAATDEQLLLSIFGGMTVYFNSTGDSKCLDLGQEDDIGAGMWSYQSCTEMVTLWRGCFFHDSTDRLCPGDAVLQ
jgi:lysosomal Pro-X carboxypeptidase